MAFEVREYSDRPAYVAHRFGEGAAPETGLPLWSGAGVPPEVHEVIDVPVMGRATVTGYFRQGRWLGVVCKPHYDDRQTGYVFGAEIKSPLRPFPVVVRHTGAVEG